MYKIMFLVAFGENCVSLFANFSHVADLNRGSGTSVKKKKKNVTEQIHAAARRPRKKTFEFTPLF